MAGPSDPVVQGLQLALVDYDSVHRVLVERCKSTAPESVDTLVSAISSWKAKNEVAIQQLRRLEASALIKLRGVSEAEANALLAQSSQFLTAGLKNQFVQVPDHQLKPACAGEYAAKTLSSPTLDFTALLAKIQSGNAYP